ncbi:MAG: peptidoglycan-associated lipoprotein Pal [Acidobacteria bacterium]|nr:peptidoglycan-associated lipoprotein Pal [Acidobacteriota bacterium]
MKKVVILSLATILVLSFFVSCKKEVAQAPPPPPQVTEQPQPKVETPPVKEEPQLTEQEMFMRKTLEEINAEKPLSLIHFDFDKYFVREDAKSILQQNAAWMKKFTSSKILIEGHCDERGTEEYNMALGEKRAIAAMDYLISLGIGADRVKIVSYGKSQPLDPGHNEGAWDMNRRGQFVVIGK